MTIGLLGRKIGMTQLFDQSGQVIPVTVIEVGPCHVLQVKTQERDGYEAIQVGFLDKPRRLARRAERGHVARLDSKRQKALVAAGIEPLAKAGCEPKRFIREFRGSVEGFQVGQELRVDIFEKVAAVDVIGITKGRGFTGAMKRHHFHGQNASHGAKKVHRHLGSTGMNTDPHHTFKGKRMPGQMGHARRTIRNLQVVHVDVEHNLLIVKGAVPGPNGGFLMIRQTNRLPLPAMKRPILPNQS